MMLGLQPLPDQNPTLLRGDKESSKRKPIQWEDSDTESTPEEKNLYCAICSHKITDESQKSPCVEN